MNDLEILGRFVQENPNDRIAARIWVDMHEEIYEWPHRTALRAVARCRVQWRRERDYARAACILNSEYEGSQRILLCCIVRAWPRVSRDTEVEIVRGYLPPWGNYQPPKQAGFRGSIGTLKVGARFIMAVHQWLYGTEEAKKRAEKIVRRVATRNSFHFE